MQRLTEKQIKGCSVLARWRTKVRKRSGWPSMTVACRLMRNQQEKVSPPGGGNGLGVPGGGTQHSFTLCPAKEVIETQTPGSSDSTLQGPLPGTSSVSGLLYTPHSILLHQTWGASHCSCQDKEAPRPRALLSHVSAQHVALPREQRSHCP